MWARVKSMLSISIHAPREGGDVQKAMEQYKEWISIHAPREGGDKGFFLPFPIQLMISIHAPREGGD